MPVLPYPVELLENHQAIHEFLRTCQAAAIHQGHAQIASLTFELKAIDPLALLVQHSPTQSVHYYCESRGQQTSLLALHTALAHTAQGPSRFDQVQQFVDQWQGHCHWLSPGGRPESCQANVRFFCQFTFFDQVSDLALGFAAANLFLPQFQLDTSRDRTTLTANLVIEPDTELAPLMVATSEFLQPLKTLSGPPRAALMGTVQDPSAQLAAIFAAADTRDFRSAVRATLGAIDRQQLHKVVLAHAVDLPLAGAFPVTRALHNLRHRHPDCYVFSVSNGQGQGFIGASPERLIQMAGGVMTTDALAGSAPRGRSAIEDRQLAQDLLSSPKERHEHQVVVDFIAEQLQQLDLTPRFSPQPNLLRLSNIQHLHTPIQAQVSGNLSPLQILKALHPTPAVAGVPRTAACEQIQQHETFERGLYAAPLGWIDPQGNSDFLVGIRSALIDADHARLYAGAGIVAGSSPERELGEIQLKLRALFDSLV